MSYLVAWRPSRKTFPFTGGSRPQAVADLRTPSRDAHLPSKRQSSASSEEKASFFLTLSYFVARRPSRKSSIPQAGGSRPPSIFHLSRMGFFKILSFPISWPGVHLARGLYPKLVGLDPQHLSSFKTQVFFILSFPISWPGVHLARVPYPKLVGHDPPASFIFQEWAFLKSYPFLFRGPASISQEVYTPSWWVTTPSR